MVKKITLHIEGLDCEDEAKLIRSAMGGVKGITSIEINIMARAMKADYDDRLVTEQDIVKAIAGTGLKARKKEEAAKTSVWWKEPRILTLSACGLIILFAFVFEHVFGISHRSASFLYGIATLIGGYYPAKMGLAAVKTLRPNIRTLMVAGAIGAASLGLWEESALLVLIYSLGDVLEAYASDRVRGAVKKLMELAPKEALVRRDGQELFIEVGEVRVGDIIVIRPGEKLPLDGKVVKGSSSLDQSSITGESMPVSKEPGDEVFAGTMNQRGTIDVLVTKPFEDTTLGKIIHYVEEAEARKSSYQRFGETFGRYYTPSMFALAILVVIIPTVIFGGFSEWFYRGLVVLVVSCSCGIALSIPVSVVAAVANAARHGVLIKGGAHLEAVSRLKAIAFDKTGSLTLGRPIVTDVVTFGELTDKAVLDIAASIESRSEHVLADAILKKAKEKGLSVSELDWFEAIPGMGAKAIINGETYCVGSLNLCTRLEVLTPDAEGKIRDLERQGKTVVVLIGSKGLLGIIAVRDELRPDARDVLKRLKNMGMRSIIMLTGDNAQAAKKISEEAGVDRFMAELLPEEKVNAVIALKKDYGMVGMVGDGVNDAPAMVASDVGIAMGAAGTDVAIETGDVVLMADDLSKIPYVIELSGRTAANIKQNIVFSLAVIAFLVPMALAGVIGLVPGILINEVGGILVIVNGLRLLK
ncbi:MAG: cation-translocating P-type ATPase [Deltaproteobacteria bacterium]|nr:cation-translocating P-type ATPase [Deltaproteobacteria bacterium]